jgi:probable phosphoglycerate mutase
MGASLPAVYLARHGETAWAVSGQHTGLTDIPLTERGKRNAVSLGGRLEGITFKHVFTSPLQRARRTCELAGFGEDAVVDPNLVEWNYGDYEGLKSAEIRQKRPDWLIFRDGCPGGESVSDVAGRADRVIARWRSLEGDLLVFSSGHFLRMIAVRWLGLEPMHGANFVLSTATLSVVGYDHNKDEPAIRLWNDGRHVGP